jgi:fibro-slime domain-containing protein
MHIALGSTGLHTVACTLGAVALVVGCAGQDVKTERTFSGTGGMDLTGGGAGMGGAPGNGGNAPSYLGGNGPGGSIFQNLNDAAPTGDASPYGDSGPPPGTVFTYADIGRYALGQKITGAGIASTGVTVKDQACNTIAGVVRDFKGNDEVGGHPDFETFAGAKPTLGMVAQDLGTDGKPVYVPLCEMPGVTAACPYSQQQTNKANFDQWYRFTDGVNKPYVIYLEFMKNGNIMTFESNNFFPLDGAGWGNNNRTHNFHFTTEIHTKFKYGGGETFTFIGDDDLWVFINGKLAMDLGGLHMKYTQVLTLDTAAATLGIQVGKEYRLDMFHAERHTSASNFRVDTNFSFTDCGSIPPDVK